MSNSAPAVSFIYVNYNLTAEIIQSVQTLVKNTRTVSYEIIIVNNGSSEPEAEGILGQLPDAVLPGVKTVTLEQNMGFGTGNNAGVKVATGEYVFLVNPDTRFTMDVTEVLFAYAKERFEPAVFAPSITDEKGIAERSFGNFPGLLSEFLGIFYLAGVIPVDKRTIQNKTYTGVDWVTGAALFMKREVFNSVQGFDERIFLYNEEVDLCKRLQERGVPVFICPDASLIHFRSVGSKKDYYRFTLNSYTSKIYYIGKHFSGFRLSVLRFFLLIHFVLLFFVWFLLIPVKGDKAKGKCAAIPQLVGTLFA